MNNLPSLRKRIDRLDLELLRLANRRAALALLIGRMKQRRRWPVFDPVREAFVLRRVMRANRGPLSSAAIRQIFQSILTQCRRRERAVTKR
mgnify:CR=1 FL=1